MINITISTEVPEFFRQLQLQSIEKSYVKLPSKKEHLLDFIDISKYNEETQLVIGSIIDTYLESSTKGSGLILLPLTMVSSECGYLILKNIEFKVLKKETGFIVEVSIPSGWKTMPTHFLNLVDGSIFAPDYTSVSKTNYLNDLVQEVVSHFELNEVIEILSNNPLNSWQIALDNYEHSIELELYNRWMKHNINLFNEPRKIL